MAKLRTCLAISILLAPLAASGGNWERPSAERDPSAADLHHAHARLLARTEGSLAGLAQLHVLGLDSSASAGLLYAEYGLLDHARKALSGAADGPERNRGLLTLARAYLTRGNAVEAEETLLSLPTLLPASLDLQRASLLSRALMYQGRYDDAALALASQSRRQELPAADRYNLGAARLRAGTVERGAAELYELGAYAGDDPMHRAVADQANVALGYWLLGRAHHGQARNVFLRVRLESPLARKAMLGLGWSEITSGKPAQPLLSRTAEACPPADAELWQRADTLHGIPRKLCRTRRFHDEPRIAQVEGLQDTQSSQYARAAVAWQAAAEDGDALDPVVAEALAALPFALAGAGDGAAAGRAFEIAVERLSAARDRLSSGQSVQLAADGPLTHLAEELRTVRGYLDEKRPATGEVALGIPNGQQQALQRRSERLMARLNEAAAIERKRRAQQLRTQLETYLIHARIGLMALQEK